ncbi:MAG: MFS transporter [Candidatus Bathyarchaeota archaeon]|nr:MFS transporter [Candidatus Bathyarchaeota archaeon]
MTIFIDITGFGIVLPLLPFFVNTFQAGSTALGVLVASFALMQFIFSPILGRLSDSFGRRPVLLLSILTSVVSFFLFALANSYFVLLLSRIIAGLATEIGVAQAYITDVTSEKERTKWMGRMGAAQGAGFIIGPALGGFLSVYGFSAAGFAAAALALLNLIFAFFFLPESKTPQKDVESKASISRFRGIISIFSKPMMSSLLAILFIMGLAFAAFPVIMPLLAISVFGLSSSTMSFFFIYIGLVQIVFQGFIVGKLASRIGDEKLIPLGAILMTVGVFFMAVFPIYHIFIVLTTIMMIGIGILGTAIPSVISKRTSQSERGSTFGVTQSISSIARIPGPLIGGFLFEYVGFGAPFFLSAFMLAIAAILGIRLILKKEHLT